MELEAARKTLKEKGFPVQSRGVIATHDMDMKEGRGVQQI
eukprot:CAMPEP_0182423616 /NCGR_PEP_ID=MMETSP1167-20130531/9668_1 /TAXON_ID=2988 /ORGANISM="Mallomonas Sp, Strain CCMP3275" /LENGTH=39 /DNA_ID= /DNA_START= /DNA_END= /DNA_ORIENTATION=